MSSQEVKSIETILGWRLSECKRLAEAEVPPNLNRTKIISEQLQHIRKNEIEKDAIRHILGVIGCHDQTIQNIIDLYNNAEDLREADELIKQAFQMDQMHSQMSLCKAPTSEPTELPNPSQISPQSVHDTDIKCCLPACFGHGCVRTVPN